MTGDDLLKLGFTPGRSVGIALKLIHKHRKALGERVLEDDLRAILKEPNAYKEHTHWAMLAEALIEERERDRVPMYVERTTPAPYRIWGEGLEAGALDQMKNAARLPVATQGALMPD